MFIKFLQIDLYIDGRGGGAVALLAFLGVGVIPSYTQRKAQQKRNMAEQTVTNRNKSNNGQQALDTQPLGWYTYSKGGCEMARQTIKCPTCGYTVPSTSWTSPPTEVSEGEIEGNYWCSRCQKEFVSKHEAKAKGKSYTIDGYVLVKVPLMGWVREHTYMWEKHNGIPLPKGFVIHHINGIKDDNRIENLIALPKRSHNSHMSK